MGTQVYCGAPARSALLVPGWGPIAERRCPPSPPHNNRNTPPRRERRKAQRDGVVGVRRADTPAAVLVVRILAHTVRDVHAALLDEAFVAHVVRSGRQAWPIPRQRCHRLRRHDAAIRLRGGQRAQQQLWQQPLHEKPLPARRAARHAPRRPATFPPRQARPAVGWRCVVGVLVLDPSPLSISIDSPLRSGLRDIKYQELGGGKARKLTLRARCTVAYDDEAPRSLCVQGGGGRARCRIKGRHPTTCADNLYYGSLCASSAQSSSGHWQMRLPGSWFNFHGMAS